MEIAVSVSKNAITWIGFAYFSVWMRIFATKIKSHGFLFSMSVSSILNWHVDMIVNIFNSKLRSCTISILNEYY